MNLINIPKIIFANKIEKFTDLTARIRWWNRIGQSSAMRHPSPWEVAELHLKVEVSVALARHDFWHPNCAFWTALNENSESVNFAMK